MAEEGSKGLPYRLKAEFGQGMKRSSAGTIVVVVITPYLHHDGSSLLLCRFLRWAELRRPDVVFEVLYRYDGPLREYLLSLSNVRGVKPLVPIRRRVLHHVESRFQARAMAALLRNSDAIYCNTVVGLQCLQVLLDSLSLPRECLPRVTVHVRELGYWIQRAGITRQSFQGLANRVIADSQLTASHLQATLGLESLCVIDEYCDTEEVVRWRGCDRLREEYNIPRQRRIVGMSGTIEWRKGPDLFLQIARHLATCMNDPPLFAWVGGGDPMATYQIESDIKRMGLESMVLFTGPRENPYPYYDSFDVFMLSSREEPFGAVCLEAAMLTIPSLCFSGCAGAESFIATGAGTVVSCFDVVVMSEALQELLENEEMRRNAGERAQRECFASHSLDALLPSLLAEVLGDDSQRMPDTLQHP
jgi:glycosyltransferase involved in cell wall biosynthesis